jgi:hypothetical protein
MSRLFVFRRCCRNLGPVFGRRFEFGFHDSGHQTLVPLGTLLPHAVEGAIVALRFLRCAESVQLLEELWNSHVLSREERVLLAISLARNGNYLSESFLEEQLQQDSESRIPIAAALAGLENPTGLREVRRLIDQLEKSERVFLEGHLCDHLERKPDVDVHDRRAVLAWLDARLDPYQDAPE